MARITPDMPQRGAARSLLNVVDNYYQPARDRMGEAAMSQGLNAASGIAQTMARKGIEEDIKEAEIKAKADVEAGEGPDAELKEVRLGNLFRPHSKAYNQVYSEAMGRKSAIEFNENLALEYEKSGLKYNTDPNKFREWMNGKVHSFLKDPANQNVYFLAGAVPTVQQQAINMGAAHMSNVSNQMERNHLAAIQKQADSMAQGIAVGDIPLEEGLNKLMTLNNQAYGTGLSGPKSRQALLSSWLTAADAANNTEMVQALLDAKENGSLQLTSKEWNAVIDQGMNIERDINFRKEQEARVAKAQREQEVRVNQDAITDFALNNPSATLQQYLASPSSNEPNAPTIADVINASPNSAEIMTKVKSAFETVNTIYDDIGSEQEQLNNLTIDTAIEGMDKNNVGELLSFLKSAQDNGYRFNEANKKYAFDEFKKAGDPDAPKSSQTYKDYKKGTVNRLIKALTPTDNPLETSLNGEYIGGQSDSIRLQFQTYLDEELAQLKGNSPAEIKAAIEAAENSVMEFYRQNSPKLFEKVYNANREQVKDNNIPDSANPYFSQEAERRVQEAASLLKKNAQLEYTDGIMDQGFARNDIRLQLGNEELFGGGQEEPTTTDQTLNALPENPAVQTVEAQVAAAEAAQAERVARIEAERAAEQARKAAERQAKLDADKVLMAEAKNVAERLNELDLNETSAEALSTLLSEIQQEFNLTIPTNYDELKFLAEDLSALQDETGVEINQEVLAKLLKAAMDRF